MTEWLKGAKPKTAAIEDKPKLTEEEFQVSLDGLLEKHKSILAHTNDLYSKHHTQELYSIIDTLEGNIRILKQLKRTE